MKKITFIGLGNIGYHIAGNLSKKGYNLTVYNRTETKTKEWLKEYRGLTQRELKTSVQDADILILCVGDDSDIKEIMLGEKGALNILKKGSIIIDHTTSSAKLARQIAYDAYQKEIGFIDGPVSGGVIGARNASLSIMCGGRQKDFEIVKPIMQTYGSVINLMGEAGSGQLTKMANQILISGTLQGVAEAIKFSKNAGLDLDKMLSVVTKGAAQSWQLENRASWMLNSKYKTGGFSVDLIQKDLSLVIEEAKINHTNIPITAIIEEYFKKLQNQEKGKWDFSSLYELL